MGFWVSNSTSYRLMGSGLDRSSCPTHMKPREPLGAWLVKEKGVPGRSHGSPVVRMLVEDDGLALLRGGLGQSASACHNVQADGVCDTPDYLLLSGVRRRSIRSSTRSARQLLPFNDKGTEILGLTGVQAGRELLVGRFWTRQIPNGPSEASVARPITGQQADPRFIQEGSGPRRASGADTG